MEIALEIIVSAFDDVVGPYTREFYPEDILKDTRNTVSSMTIDFFTNSMNVSDELAIMSFPQLKKKGLIKIIEWDDPTKRGGKQEATLSILFEEKNDPVLYKYQADIEEQINEFLTHFLQLIRKKEDDERSLQDNLKTFHQDVQELLLKLDAQEKQISENAKPFPQTKEQAKKTAFAFKSIVIGDPSVGKTSTILQYTQKAFRRSYIPTIGANFTEKSIFLHNTEFQMIIWDLAGQSKFQSIRSMYYQGAQCIIIIFDLTKPESFESVRKWYTDVWTNFSNFIELAVVLCGNKSDLAKEIQVSNEEALNLAADLKIPYLEISARNGKNVDEIFQSLINILISKGIIGL